MAKRRGLVQLEIPNNNGGGWILTPKFEMMILKAITERKSAENAQQELEADNRRISRRLKRQKYLNAARRFMLRFVGMRKTRPDLSSREIGRRLGLSQRQTDAVVQELTRLGIKHRKLNRINNCREALQ